MGKEGGESLENPEKSIWCTKEKISLVSIPFGALAHSSVVNRPRPTGWPHYAQGLSLQGDSEEAGARKGSRNLLKVSEKG